MEGGGGEVGWLFGYHLKAGNHVIININFSFRSKHHIPRHNGYNRIEPSVKLSGEVCPRNRSNVKCGGCGMVKGDRLRVCE